MLHEEKLTHQTLYTLFTTSHVTLSISNSVAGQKDNGLIVFQRMQLLYCLTASNDFCNGQTDNMPIMSSGSAGPDVEVWVG